MNRFFILLIGLLAMCNAMANDGSFSTAGNQLVPIQNTNISVKKEVLTIKLQNDGFTSVDVYYEFYNKEKTSKNVLMGFEAMPPYNYSFGTSMYSKKHGAIKKFTVTVNGQPISYKNEVSKAGIYNGLNPVVYKKIKTPDGISTELVDQKNDTIVYDYSYVYYFTAHFKPGKNIIHHTYLFENSIYSWPYYNIQYKLTPATRWANHQIDDFTLKIIAKNVVKHFYIDKTAFVDGDFYIEEGFGKVRDLYRAEKNEFQNHDTITEISLRNGVAIWHANNYCPKAEFFIATVQDLMYGDFQEKKGVEFDETSYYDGCFCGIRTYETPLQNDSVFAERIYRNLPYAARGYVFKNKQLNDYFQSQWWYMPDSSYVPDAKEFTENDKKVIWPEKYDKDNE